MHKLSFPVVDLHNDLLLYLTHKDERKPQEMKSLSSTTQMQTGNIKLQILAISTMTAPDSVQMGSKQVEAFTHLLKTYNKDYALFKKSTPFSPSLIYLLPAIENASVFASENEPIKISLMRLEKYISIVGHLVYISLTWNGENRFGGGCGSSHGLREDGKELLKLLDKKQIAVDFSHVSDRLGHELLNYIDKHNLNIPVMASHSNFRAVHNVIRNLSEDLAKELIRRKGLIGLNLFAPFSGCLEKVIEHIQYGLNLGGEDALSLGADFFCAEDFPHITTNYPNQTLFFPELADTSCYPYLFSVLKDKLSLKEETLKKLSSKNALRFLNRLLL